MILFKLVEVELYRCLPSVSVSMISIGPESLLYHFVHLTILYPHYLIPYVHGNVLKCGIYITV